VNKRARQGRWVEVALTFHDVVAAAVRVQRFGRGARLSPFAYFASIGAKKYYAVIYWQFRGWNSSRRESWNAFSFATNSKNTGRI